MLDDTKNVPLENMKDVFDLTNMVKKPTCHTNIGKPSLVDVILTNKPSACGKICNFPCGISDVHNCISVQLDISVKSSDTRWRNCRSFKNYNHEDFISDLQEIDFNFISPERDVNTVYGEFSNNILDVMNKHAPFKKRKIRDKQVPYFNTNLRKAIYRKKMLHHKYQKVPNSTNWENYRVQRNLVNKIKRKSINDYFVERCAGGPKAKDFWPTIKPFITNKGANHQKDTVLCENEKLVTKQQDVCAIFNTFFVNVAKDIGTSDVKVDADHPSVSAIQENVRLESSFQFKPVTEEFIHKQIKSINVKKATGIDTISPKLLHLAEPVILKPLTELVNMSLQQSIFPDQLKTAQVVPLHKKNSILDKGNYRPVSVLLPTISKIFERAINSQIMEHFNTIFNPFLAAFRAGYGCQTTLLRVIEDWKKALDENKYIAAILMDLSKAFDCLPHDLLLLKMEYYGLSSSAVDLVKSYLSNRNQCVKLGSFTSQFDTIFKGVPQGSILGPVLFNVFINDIFMFVKKSNLYNYADDNTLSATDRKIENVIESLSHDSNKLLDWFHINQMQANPEKFQGIAIGKKSHDAITSLKLNDTPIVFEDEVKLLGVTIDFQLNFNTHISNICKKASRQLNCLKRLGKFLTRLGRLTVYHSFILSNFNYCPLTWHFCSEINTKKMERIQERALRFIYDDFLTSYEEFLVKSKLPSLKLRRIRTMALESFKIINKDCPVILHDLLTVKHNHYNFRYHKTVEVPHARTTRFGLQSFRHKAAATWNSLPDDVRCMSSFNQFKSFISNWDGPQCKCSACRR